jgi:sulfite reductase alpha subunit-like flavoprotein
MQRYAKFNATGKRLDKRLEMLGGQRLVPLGLGDDQDANGEKAPKSQDTLPVVTYGIHETTAHCSSLFFDADSTLNRPLHYASGPTQVTIKPSTRGWKHSGRGSSKCALSLLVLLSTRREACRHQGM